MFGRLSSLGSAKIGLTHCPQAPKCFRRVARRDSYACRKTLEVLVPRSTLPALPPRRNRAVEKKRNLVRMATLDQELALLKTRGLVRAALERGKPFVRFKHALTYQATYNSILQSRRVELHRAAAQTLMELYPAPDLEMALTIAEHWQRGNKDARALETISPHAQNLIYTGRSISLTALLTRLHRENLNETEQLDLDIALADAHAARGEYEPARRLYENVLLRADSDARRAQLLQSLGVAAYHLGNYADAIQFYRSSLELAQALGDTALQARSTGGLGLAFFSLGATDKADEFLQASRALSRQNGESIELATAEYNLAMVQRAMGQYAQAIACAENALRLEQKFQHTAAAARSLQLLGACYHSMGDLETATEYYRRAILGSHALGDALATAIVQSNLAELLTQQQNFTQAIDLYRQALGYFRETKQDYALAYNLAGLAQVELRRYENGAEIESLAHASQTATEALEIAQKIQSPEAEGIAYRVLAEIAAAQKNLEQAEQYIAASVERLSQAHSLLELERAYRVYGQLLKTSADAEKRAKGAAFLDMAAKGVS